MKDAGEPPLAGVQVTLTVTWPNGNTVAVGTTTDAAGAYSFANLLLDESYDGVGATYGSGGDEPAHVVTVAAPSGFTSTYDSAPDATGIGNGTDDNADNTAGEPAFPAEGGSDNTNDFGFRGTGSIGDLVWVDLDNNGTQDAGEPGIPSVTLNLTWYGADGAPGGGDDYVYTTATNASGAYDFTSLPPGNFSVNLDDTTCAGLGWPSGSTTGMSETRRPRL